MATTSPGPGALWTPKLFRMLCMCIAKALCDKDNSTFCSLIKNAYLESWCPVLHKHCQEAGVLVW